MYYSPVRHSPPGASSRAAVRLACVKHAASVQSEPGSNSFVYTLAKYSRTQFNLLLKVLDSHLKPAVQILTPIGCLLFNEPKIKPIGLIRQALNPT